MKYYKLSKLIKILNFVQVKGVYSASKYIKEENNIIYTILWWSMSNSTMITLYEKCHSSEPKFINFESYKEDDLKKYLISIFKSVIILYELTNVSWFSKPKNYNFKDFIKCYNEYSA